MSEKIDSIANSRLASLQMVIFYILYSERDPERRGLNSCTRLVVSSRVIQFFALESSSSKQSVVESCCEGISFDADEKVLSINDECVRCCLGAYRHVIHSKL